MTIESIIAEGVVKAVKELYGADVQADKVMPSATRKDFEGDFTVMVFPLVRMSHKSPEETGAQIGEWMTMNVPAIEKFNVVKGFLNLSVSASYWLNLLHGIAADPDWGIRKPEADAPLVMVEYSSPNTNKPLHLGHVRNNLLGYSLSQILAANGNKVVKTNIVNDRGIHICKSMLAWKKWGENATPESTGKKGDHLIGDFYVAFDKHFRQEVKEIMERDNVDEDEAKRRSPLMTEAHEMLVKWEQGDPEVRTLWKMMNDWVYAGFDETYKRKLR